MRKTDEDKKKVTQNDVAKAAGVTRSMVSYVISGTSERSVAPETRKRILDVIQQLGYRPNKAAQALQLGDVAFASKNIGVVLPNSDLFLRPFYTEILEGIFTAAHEHNYNIKFVRFFRELKDPVLFNELIHPESIGSLILLAVNQAVKDEEDEKIYNVSVGYLYDGNKRRGYLITFTDDTANRKYIQLLDTYNEKLQSEVEEKTRHIVEMHDHLIMSLAMMVESRDNSTGGHIKRTSEGVRILIDAILEDGSMELSEEFCKDVIKAAPMHDLGKVAVDDAILRKPGRFTDEEFEQMKKHAAEGAKVIHEILLHTDDESFKKIAENVAHYHHERWDGSGYPEGLKGEEIPLEARIMAVADVYDALVSKRVYKEAFDFEKANRIIMEGMGSQFDPGLQRIYEKARPKLEAIY